MKKLFFCLFSTLFIALCLWLGMYGETYAYYSSDNNLHYVAKNSDSDYKNLFKNCTDFAQVMSVLEEINIFSDRTNRDIELCNYNELFSENYCYTISTSDSSYHQIEFYFAIPSNSYNLGKYSFDTKGLNVYYTTPSAIMCLMRINIYNSNNELYEWYFQYLNYNAVFVNPKSQPNVNYTNFNNNYSESFTNLILTYNDNILSGTPSPVEPPTEEDDRNILELLQDFFANFGDNLVHIVVPSQEDMEELQESFEDNILNKFAISSISRSSTYDNNSLYPLEYENHKPVFNIYGYEFQSSMITDFMNTPISFGKLQNYQSTTEHSTDIVTGGLTPFAIINLSFGISITILNIVLFNKFFEKE